VWRGAELAGLAVAFGLGLVTRPTARLEVADRRGAERDVGLDVIILGPKAVSTIDASDPVEPRRLSQLQGQADLDRGMARPPLEVAEIFAVEENAVQKGIGGDLLGDLR
jgi:hypothetical protein